MAADVEIASERELFEGLLMRYEIPRACVEEGLVNSRQIFQHSQ